MAACVAFRKRTRFWQDESAIGGVGQTLLEFSLGFSQAPGGFIRHRRKQHRLRLWRASKVWGGKDEDDEDEKKKEEGNGKKDRHSKHIHQN